jgi:Leucine-rich repeat (LRR) protein
MDRNYFKHLNISAIGHHLPNLAYLDVSFNNVEVITTGRLPNMIELELHHNYIDVDGMFYSNGYCNFPNLQIINLGVSTSKLRVVKFKNVASFTCDRLFPVKIKFVMSFGNVGI